MFLVTGATGAIGSKVTAALLDSGARVRGQYARAPGSDPRIEWRQANFSESLDVDRLVEGCDGIIHLAGEVARADAMHRVNVDATEALIKAASKAGVRYFGHASSMVVYGSPDRRDIDEQTPIVNPFFPMSKQFYAAPTAQEYARTKAMAEMVIRQADPGLNLDILRITKSAGFERLLESLHVLLHANMTSFSSSANGAGIESITVQSLTQRSMTIKAKMFVLCCNGIENARLLLNAPEPVLARINAFDTIGRYFAQHPRGSVATLRADARTAVRLQRTFSIFLTPRRAPMRYEMGFALSDEAQRKHQLLNATAAAWVTDTKPIGEADLSGNYHFIGATRMSPDPRDGVVNANCKVHGVDNLYVAGCSVFPTGGHANPTLTIVALAIRLADHLRSRLKN